MPLRQRKRAPGAPLRRAGHRRPRRGARRRVTVGADTRVRASVRRGHDRRGRRVDVDRVVDVAGVAAGEDHDDGDTGAAQAVDDQLVACAQAGLGQGQASEAVALERVGAGEIEGDVGVALAQPGVEGFVERPQVVAVAGPGREVDVEV